MGFEVFFKKLIIPPAQFPQSRLEVQRHLWGGHPVADENFASGHPGDGETSDWTNGLDLDHAQIKTFSETVPSHAMIELCQQQLCN